MSYSYSTGGSGYQLGNITLASTSATTWTSSYPLGVSTGTYAIAGSTPASVKISDTGIVNMKAGTDLIIGGKSIKAMLEKIESRLAILEVNHQLEAEWEELKRLGDAYRELEKEIHEKMETWNILKNDN